MKRKKILQALSELIDSDLRKHRKHVSELKKLLRKLKAKEFDIEEKLLGERDDYKQKRLNKELEIVRAQYEKGMQALASLETDSDKEVSE